RRRSAEPDPHRQHGGAARLAARGALVETGTCRRAILLRHFGESPPATCGNCDNCMSPPASIDATQTAQKFLSAVYRTGQSFGAGHIESVLTGATTDRIRERGHDRISVYGIVDGEETALLRPVSRALLVRDALETTEHGGLMLGPNARPILRGEEEVRIVLPPRRERRKRSARNGSEANP